MPIAIGDRFVRRHDAARGSTANATAADITYDTAVLSEGDYTWASPEVTVDTAGLYLCVFDLGQCDIGSTRAVGTLVPSINTVDQTRFRATHRYLRNSGGTEGASIGKCMLNLSASDDVKVRNPGVLTPTDALGNYATRSGFGGALQMLRLPDGNLTHVERTSDAAEVGTSNINTTRPWLDSSGTWTTVTFNSEVQDDDALYSGSGGDVTLAANTKYAIAWGVTPYSTDASRHTYVGRLRINAVNVQHLSSYQRNTGSQGPPINGLYFYETGGSAETLNIQMTHETEGGDAGTPQVADAYLQVLELPSSAEWIHIDNGATDSLTTALAGTGTWYETPFSSTFRADGNSNLSLDAVNNAVQNDSGGVMRVLATAWAGWDRDTGSSGTRKMPWGAFNNNGTRVAYGLGGAFSRGQQSTDDCWQARYNSVAMFDLAAGADLTYEHNEPASAANSDMGVYASTSRHFLGMQVLDLDTLESASSPQTIAYNQVTETDTPQAYSVSTSISASFGQVIETDTAQAYGLGPDFILSLSSNFADGDPTTSQLTGGTGTFTAGEMQESTNPTAAIDIGNNGNTEVEFAIEATAFADLANYNFRITVNGTPLDTYTVTPQATVQAGSSVAFSQVIETDLPQAFVASPGAVTVAYGQVVETDLPQAFTATPGQVTVAYSQVLEIDLPQNIGVLSGAVSVSFGQVVETDTAQAIGSVVDASVAYGQVTETDTAQIYGILQGLSVAYLQVTETDTPQPFTATPGVTVIGYSQVVETDLPQSYAVNAGPVTVGYNQVLETDLPQVIAPVQGAASFAFGQVVETDTPQPYTADPGLVTIGYSQVVETDTPQPFLVSTQISVPFGQVVETDIPQAITVVTTATVGFGQVVETDIAQTIVVSGAGQQGYNAVLEINTPQVFNSVVDAIIGFGRVDEIDLPQPFATGTGPTSPEVENINDAIKLATGFDQVNDGLADFFGKTADEHINDAERRWLISQGATPGQLNDMWIDAFGATFGTATYNETYLAYWNSQRP